MYAEASVCRCSSRYVSGLQFCQKETPTQVLSCDIAKIFKNSFFYRTPPLAASVYNPPDTCT